MAFATAGRAEDEQIGALLEPVMAGRQGHDLGLGEHRHGLELEAVEALAWQQAGFGEMTLDASAVAFGQFMLGQGGQEAGCRPALLVGLLGEVRPHGLDARQAQFAEQQVEPSGVDGFARAHAGSPLSRAS